MLRSPLPRRSRICPLIVDELAILDGSASGTAAHTVTVTNGTLNGTNKVATLNAPGEMLLVYVGEDGNGTVILNNGGVALS